MNEITTPKKRVGPKPKPLAVRLDMQTDKSGGCWLWTGAVSGGYGRIMDTAPSKKKLLAHRVAFEIAKGPIPDGMFIDHRCQVTICVNPKHLRLATNKQNQEHLEGPMSNNKSGYLGVHEYYPNCWRGKAKHNGKDYYTTRCSTPEEAAEAVRKLRLELFTHNDRDR